MYSLYACVPRLNSVHVLQAVSVIKSLGGNVKMLVTNPKEEEEGKKKDGTGNGNHKKTLVHAFREKLFSFFVKVS
jgi:hypothetical protein